MSKISKRLKSIAELVSVDDRVVDVGCDHGLLSIYLVETKKLKKVIASDVNKNALSFAIKNIKEADLDIETVLSDGIDDVDLTDINTLIIAGMGASTIKHILANTERLKGIEKIICQSNNDYELLRTYMNSIGYYLNNELYVFDKGKWYVQSSFIKSDKKNSKNVLKYGLLNNEAYNDYLIESKKKILDKIPKESSMVRETLENELELLKRAICK